MIYLNKTKKICRFVCILTVCIFTFYGSCINSYASVATYYKSGNRVKISYDGEHKNAHFIIAKYNFDNSLAECSISKIAFNNNQFTSSTIILSNQYKYKFMLWDFQQIRPLSTTVSVDINTPNTNTADDGFTDRY